MNSQRLVNSLPVLIALTFAAAANAAEEPVPAGYYAAIAAAADDEDSRNLNGEFGVPLGERGWLHLGLGSSTATVSDAQVDSTLGSISGGLDTERVSFDLGFSYRKDSDAFAQQDLRGSITLNLARGGVGLDLFHRAAEDETVTSIQRRRRDPREVRTVQSIAGTGIGAHLRFDVTEQLELSASGMTYDYDSEVQGPAFLDRFPRLALRVSGVSRDEAFLDNTMRGGVTYRIGLGSVTGEYIRDRELNTQAITDTFELSGSLPLGELWAISPWVGRSSDDLEGSVLYGGLSISVVW